MTTEIAIMNRTAVALAADSAVTIQTGDGQKVYNSVNKLFTLSKYHPIGIMIYGSAELMRVPWETIIKVYRKKIGKRQFNTVREYAEDFIKTISANPLFPEDVQKNMLVNILQVILL